MRDLCCQDLLQATYELSHLSLGDCVNLLVCMCMRVGRHLCYSIFSWLPFKIPMCVRERTCGCLLRFSEHLEGSLLSRCSISSRLSIKMSHLSLGDPYVCERENLWVFTVCV